MNKKNGKNRWLALALSLALLVPMLAACSKGGEKAGNEQTVLRIATSMGYGPDDEWFRSQFTEIFEFAYPNIKIEVIPTFDDRFRFKGPEPGEEQVQPFDKLKELIDGPNPPDLVMVQYEELSDLIMDNKLAPLDSLITKDKFDTADFVPSVIDGLKKVAPDGKLYALAPTFSSNALIYNKALFDEVGVPYPTDRMTWDEAFNLARRVSRGEGNDRKYGFSFSQWSYGDNFYDMAAYTAPLQLRMFDETGEKMTVDTDQWENVWKTMLQLKTEKLTPEQPDYNNQPKDDEPREFNPYEGDAFLSGRVAMTIVPSGYLNEVNNANKSAENVETFTPVDWGVVTVPVHPEAPDVGGFVNMNGIMGITANAQNSKDAWTFLSFINGERWAEIKSRSNWNMVSRKKYIEKIDGLDYNVAAFYTLTPAPNPYNDKIFRNNQNIWQVQNIGQMKFQEVVNNNKSVRDALKEWQTEGDAMLQQIKENPDGNMDIMMQKEMIRKAAGE